MVTPTLEDAIALSAQAHKGAFRRDGQPYILHPLRVMLKVSKPHERIAAILHDVVEDTDVTLDDLRKRGYPEEVVAAVDALSRREGEDYNEFIKRASHNDLARVVKTADLEDNLKDSSSAPRTARDLERVKKYEAAWEYLTGKPWTS